MKTVDLELLHKSVNEVIDHTLEEKRIVGTVVQKAYPSGGAGMIGRARDFLKLLEVLRKGGEPILPSALVTQMTSNQIGALSCPIGQEEALDLGSRCLKIQRMPIPQNHRERGGWAAPMVIPGSLIRARS